MAKHKQRMEAETDAEKRSEWAQKMELWKRALTQVADLKGKDAKDRKEAEFIKEVVTDIHRRLGVPLSNNLPRLIGVDDYIKFIGSWLTEGSSHTADILTIVGMAGIGKTSLAKYVFWLHSSKFHKSSFIEGINTRCKEHFNGLLDLQKQLHGDITKKISLHVNDVSVYTSKIENALVNKVVFIVLDDIDSLDQLDALLGNKGLHPGSKIIITTKDASLTERCALFNSKVHPNHRKVSLNGLSETDSQTLLCIHAFKSQKPKEGFEEVSVKLAKYCEGHPMALNILGRSLHKREVTYWEECIKGLNKELHSRIKTALQLSYDSLPSKNDMELFKHIACFFVGKDKDVTEVILNACDINTRSGIMNLTDRCMLSIDQHNKLMMHQLVQEMGRDLVRQESPEKPWKRSRLWCHEESFKVLKQKNGKQNLLGLTLDMRMLDRKKFHGSSELNTASLSKMDNLMLLQLNYVQLNGSFENFPEELRWLCMHGFPLKSIPLELRMANLVALDMSYSSIESFDMSKDKLLLGSLKILDLSFCEQLHSLGGFSKLPALQRFIVRKCISLIEVCESIKQCDELVHVDLSYCYKLKKLPISIEKLKKVETLLLDGIDSREFQSSDASTNLRTSSSAIMEAIPSDLKFLMNFLPRSLKILSIANNNLSNESFPMDFSCLFMLEELCLNDNPIVSMPSCVRSLPRLERLYMDNCKMLKVIEHPPRTLRNFSLVSSYKPSLRKIKFDPEMSPLGLRGAWIKLLYSSLEIDGMVKIQPVAGVEGKLLHCLGWTNLKFIKQMQARYHINGISCVPAQMYYEFGIFSTFYKGKEMPKWILCRSDGPSISFTIPSSPNKLQGLNFCYAETCRYNQFVLPVIKISNITKNHTWIYHHCIEVLGISERRLILLSHWMFGPNEMKGGDHITITVGHKTHGYIGQVTKECGISVVYEDDGKIEEEEEDVLSYYKSWNHILGGDLSAFQLTTGEYILHNMQFERSTSGTYGRYLPFIDDDANYKEDKMMSFKAFSQRSLKQVLRYI